MIYYIFCVEMHMSEEVFYKSSLGKIISLINIHTQFKSGKLDKLENQEVEIISMKQIPGFI